MSETSSFEEADWTWLHAAPAGSNKLLFYPSCLLKIHEEQTSPTSMELACVTHNMNSQDGQKKAQKSLNEKAKCTTQNVNMSLYK